MDELKKVTDELLNTKAALEAQNETIAQLRKATEEHETKGTSNGAQIEALKDQLVAINERYDELKKAAVPGVSAGNINPESAREEKALNAFFKSADARELKDLTGYTDAQGGYMMPKAFNSQVIKQMVDRSPILGLTDLKTISMRQEEIPEDLSTPTFRNADGLVTMPSDAGMAFGNVVLKTHVFDALVKYHPDLEADSPVNLINHIQGKMADAMSLKIEDMIFQGNKVTEFEGIKSNANVSIISATLQTVTMDNIRSFLYQLSAPYARNGAIAVRRQMLGVIATLKDATSGLFYWQPPSATNPGTILGVPVYEVATTALSTVDKTSGNTLMIYGDYSKYIARMRDDMTIRILDQLYAPQFAAYVRFRCAGAVGLAEAFKILKSQ